MSSELQGRKERRRWQTLVNLPLAVVLMAMAESGAGAQRSDFRSPQLQVSLPVTSETLRAVLLRLSTVRKIPFAIEVVAGGAASPNPSAPRVDRVLVLTELSVEAALERLTALQIEGPVRQYVWSVDQGVYHVRPAIFVNNRGVALNKVISDFRSETSNLLDALRNVRGVLEPQPLPQQSRAPQRMPETARRAFQRPISVSVPQGSISKVLDAMVRAHGEMSWLAEYGDGRGGQKALRLTFFGFDNWSYTTTVSR